MPNYSKNDVVLVRYPFTDLSRSKVRPAVVVNPPHTSQDLLLVALTSKTGNLLSGEFQLTGWSQAGLNVPTAVKRGLFTIRADLVLKKIGQLTRDDSEQLKQSLRLWLGID
ncbi:MAG: type II toxin-antitoxin system PemK/MazF family toxin [Cyanobacteria bacterium P01_F01_bin.13]